MAYVVKAYQIESINLAPQSTEEEVLQNVAMIISTPQFSVPLDRGFGLSQEFVDKPIPAQKALLVSAVLNAVEQKEPRVTVKSVTFQEGEKPGALIPVVEVSINDD